MKSPDPFAILKDVKVPKEKAQVKDADLYDLLFKYSVAEKQK